MMRRIILRTARLQPAVRASVTDCMSTVQSSVAIENTVPERNAQSESSLEAMVDKLESDGLLIPEHDRKILHSVRGSENVARALVLQSKLVRLKNPADVLDAVAVSIRDFDPAHASTALSRLASTCNAFEKLSIISDSRFLDLMDATRSFIPSMDVVSLSHVLYGFASLKYVPEWGCSEVFKRWIDASQLSEGVTTKQAASVLHAIRKIRGCASTASSAADWSAFEKHVAGQLPAILENDRSDDPASCIRLLVALAANRIGDHETQKALLQSIASSGRLEEINYSDLSSLVWSMAKSGIASAPILSLVKERFAEECESVSVKDLVTTIWSLSKLSFQSVSKFHQGRMPTFSDAISSSTRDVSPSSGGPEYEEAVADSREYFQYVIAPVVRQRVAELATRDLAQIMWCLDRAGVHDAETMNDLTVFLERDIPQMGPADLVSLVVGISRSGSAFLNKDSQNRESAESAQSAAQVRDLGNEQSKETNIGDSVNVVDDSVDDVGGSVNSLSDSVYVPPLLLKRLAASVQNFTPQQCSDTVAALSRLGIFDAHLLQLLVKQAQRLGSHFRSDNATEMLVALAGFREGLDVTERYLGGAVLELLQDHRRFETLIPRDAVNLLSAIVQKRQVVGGATSREKVPNTDGVQGEQSGLVDTSSPVTAFDASTGRVERSTSGSESSTSLSEFCTRLVNEKLHGKIGVGRGRWIPSAPQLIELLRVLPLIPPVKRDFFHDLLSTLPYIVKVRDMNHAMVLALIGRLAHLGWEDRAYIRARAATDESFRTSILRLARGACEFFDSCLNRVPNRRPGVCTPSGALDLLYHLSLIGVSVPRMQILIERLIQLPDRSPSDATSILTDPSGAMKLAVASHAILSSGSSKQRSAEALKSAFSENILSEQDLAPSFLNQLVGKNFSLVCNYLLCLWDGERSHLEEPGPGTKASLATSKVVEALANAYFANDWDTRGCDYPVLLALCSELDRRRVRLGGVADRMVKELSGSESETRRNASRSSAASTVHSEYVPVCTNWLSTCLTQMQIGHKLSVSVGRQAIQIHIPSINLGIRLVDVSETIISDSDVQRTPHEIRVQNMIRSRGFKLVSLPVAEVYSQVRSGASLAFVADLLAPYSSEENGPKGPPTL